MVLGMIREMRRRVQNWWQEEVGRRGLDKAQLTKNLPPNGGIDLSKANGHLQLQNAGQAIKFHLDPAQLARFKNAPGFTPVIISIRPVADLKEFLGITQA